MGNAPPAAAPPQPPSIQSLDTRIAELTARRQLELDRIDRFHQIETLEEELADVLRNQHERGLEVEAATRDREQAQRLGTSRVKQRQGCKGGIGLCGL